jgi:hypothetical protein
MNTKTCTEAFQLGQAHSLRNKRTQGAYKLSERLRQWEDCVREVECIATALNNKSLKFYLKHCTFEDKHVWLRRILKHIAYELSADIAPSYKALKGDGMSDADIALNLPHVNKIIQDTLRVLENAQLSIKGPIQNEYDRMQQGWSIVGDALVIARQALEDIINLTPPKIQSQIY